MDETRDPVAGLVRRAAATVADHPADSAQVRRRWQRRRRRRAAVGAVGLAATVAVVAGVLPTLLGERGTTPVTGGTTAAGPPAAASPAAPAQRLLLDGAWLSAGGQRGPDTSSGGEISELLPDGEVVRHRLPDLDGWSRLAALPDGGLVGLGYDDLRPGVPRVDGPAVTDLSIRLAVLSAAGGVETLREVGGSGKPVKLLAATAEVAYLWRPAGLVAHDLGTGAERAVPTGGILPGLQDRSAISRIDLAGDRLVIGDTPADSCRLRVVDLRTGATAEPDLRHARCAGIGRLRVSPDGRLAAIAYQRATVSAAGGTPDQRMRVAVVDLDDGRLTADTVVAGPAAGTPGFAPKQPAGMAWSDNGTLRVATTAGAGPRSPEAVRQQQIRAGHN